MGIAYHPHRLAPLYGLIISLLPVAVVLQEYWWYQHPLQAAVFIFLLAVMVYYTLREFQQELATRGHEGGHGLMRSAHLVMVAVFALGCFGAWRLIVTFAFGNPNWSLPEIIPRDNSTYVDLVHYATALVLLVAIYWLGTVSHV